MTYTPLVWLLLLTAVILAGVTLYARRFRAVPTALKQTEAELRKLSRAVEQSANAIVITDLAGTIEFVNPAFTRVTGYTYEEAIGQNPRILKSNYHPPEFYQDMWTNLTSGQIWQSEMLNKRKDGTLYWEYAIISPVKDELGHVTNYVAIKEDITQRKQVEAELRQSEERYRLLADHSTDVIWTLDLQGRFTYVSPSVERLRGYTPAEVMKQSLPEALSPGSLEVVVEALGRVYQAEAAGHHYDQTGRYELEQPCKDGSTVWTEVISNVMRNQAGDFIGILGVTRDITKRKQAEETLHASEKKYRQLVELAQEGIWVTDAASCTTFVNPKLAEILGYPVEAIMGQPQLAFMDERGAEIYRHNLEHRRQGIKEQPDFEFIRQDGQRIYVIMATSSITDETGNWMGAIALLTDVTERRQAQEAFRQAHDKLEKQVAERTAELLAANLHLRQGEERFRRVISSISDHVYATEITAEGERVNLYISPNVASLTGYPVEKFSSDWNFWAGSVIHPDDRARAAVHALQLPLQASGEIEYRLVRADGQIIWVRDKARVEQQGDSKVVYGIVSDITEHRRIEQEAADLKVLQEVSRIRAELIDNVSHELRTPLGIIRAASSSLLADDVEFEPAIQHRFLSGIYQETERLELIVNNLLNLSRLEKQQLRLNLNIADISRLATGVVEVIQMQFKADQAGLKLVADFPTEPLLAHIDIRQIEQVLRNLLSNAVKYSLHGGIITLAGRREDRWLHLSVSDQGIGIAPADLKRIFERFYRVEQAATAHISGTGLGLAISREIIQAHGGRIWAESEPGQGSTFHFTLPVDPTDFKESNL